MSLLKPEGCCSKPSLKYKKNHDKNFVLKLEDYNKKLFDSCEVQKRAVKNWQRLRIVLLLLQVCGGRTIEHTVEAYKEEPKKKKTCKERLAKYIINPLNTYKTMWDSAVGLLFLSAFVLDPLIYAFHMVHLENEHMNTYMTAISIIFIIDIILVPFTGIDKGLNDQAII